MTGQAKRSSRLFLDTNVLVYAYDRAEPAKQQQARSLLGKLVSMGAGAVSTQVLSEFFVTITRKIRRPLTLEEALKRLAHHSRLWMVIPLTPSVVLHAATAVLDHQMSLWDAQLWAAANLSGLGVILSEDLSDRSLIGGVRFVNPFSPRFHLSDWV